MAAKDIEARVAKLAEELLSDSQGSIDYGINAKAIAFMNEDVRKKVVSVISEGFALNEVRPLQGFGASLMNFKVVVEFTRNEKDPIINMPKRALTITVEIPTRSVSKIEEGVRPAIGAAAAPFTIVNPNPAVAQRGPISELWARRAVERQYYRDIGLPGYGPVVPGVGNPGDPSGPFPPGGQGPVVINPGGPFGGFGSGAVTGTETLTPANTQSGCETESDGIGDDSANDDVDYDGSRGDDASIDAQIPDIGFRRWFY